MPAPMVPSPMTPTVLIFITRHYRLTPPGPVTGRAPITDDKGRPVGQQQRSRAVAMAQWRISVPSPGVAWPARSPALGHGRGWGTGSVPSPGLDAVGATPVLCHHRVTVGRPGAPHSDRRGRAAGPGRVAEGCRVRGGGSPRTGALSCWWWRVAVG